MTSVDLILAPPIKPMIVQRPSTHSADALAELDYLVEKSADDDADGVERGEPRWKITGSPLVVVAAMKLFSGARSGKRDAVSFPAGDGAFEDLLMLMHRFPLRLTTRAQGVWEGHYLSVVLKHDGGAAPIRRRATSFKGTLLPFQLAGVEFMCAHRKCLLADDMGLGKTVMGFGFLDRVQAWPAVIVCQPHVQRHWERKIEEFMEVRPAGGMLLDRGKAETSLPTWLSLVGARASEETAEADIYIVHYLVLYAWAPLLAGRGIRTVIFDEVQELRHTGTRKADVAAMISKRAHNVVGLSGTPIYNYGAEAYTVVNSIAKGALGTRVDFEKLWCDFKGDKRIVIDPDLLGTYLRDANLMLRRMKDEVQSQLPSKRRVVEPIDADRVEFANLVRAAAELAREAQNVADPFDRARMEQEAIRQTRQATGIAKSPAIVAFLRGLMEAGEPTIVFAHHHAVHDAICEALAEFNPLRVTGHETSSMKDEAVQRFRRGETNLITIALRAATGIDGLQDRARCVVFAELDWSPAIHNQAEDRAHRMGQRESVIVYYLVTDLGTDPDMMMVLNLKQRQFTGIMHDKEETEEDRATAETAAKEHMENVLAMLRATR